jgi:hypothetical protein
VRPVVARGMRYSFLQLPWLSTMAGKDIYPWSS